MTTKKNTLTGICYDIIGNDQSSDTLLFIHGAGGNMIALKALASQLMEYKCVLIDLPGHNLSEGNAALEVMDYAETLEKFIKSEKGLLGENITCIGHSMGGCISLALGLKNIPEIKQLVILNSGAKLEIDSNFMQKVKSGKIDKMYLYKAGGSYFHPRTYKFFFSSFKQMITSQKVMITDFICATSFDARDKVKEIKLPTLIVTGEKEILAIPDYSKYLNSQIEGSKLVIMEGLSHLMPIIAPEKLAAEIRSFLSTHQVALNNRSLVE